MLYQPAYLAFMEIFYLVVPNLEYRAGACNIGAVEKSKRKTLGLLAIAFAVLLAILLYIAKIEPVSRLLIFFPLSAGIISLYQVKENFCVAFGMSGVYNVSGTEKKVHRVKSPVDRKIDINKSLRMVVLGSVVSLVITVSFFLLPG